jgi:hypothetical protein
MDGTRMQALVSKGYRIAGSKAGTTYTQYRPTDPLAPLGNQIGTITAAFDAKAAFRFDAPNEYGDSRWYGLFDTSAVDAGDYLTGQLGTYFVAAVQPLLPAFCISCNTTVDLLRMPANAAPGLQPYTAVSGGSEVTLLSAWPASLLFGGRASRGEAGLPGELGLASYLALLPAFAGATVQPGDVLRDANGLRYNVQSAELSDLGWRIYARLAEA